MDLHSMQSFGIRFHFDFYSILEFCANQMRNSGIWSVGLPILLGAEARMPAPERAGQGSPVLPAHAQLWKHPRACR